MNVDRKCSSRANSVVGGIFTFISSAAAQSDKEVNASFDESFGQKQIYQTFFSDLKKAIATDDKKTVAAWLTIRQPFHRRQGCENQVG